MDVFRDKKLIIGAMLSVAILLVVFLVTGYISLPFYSVDRGDNLGCLNMLPISECRGGRSITYLGREAVGFNLSEGTEVYAPFNGAFFEDEVLYEDEEDTIIAKSFVRGRFGIVDTPSFVVFVADHSPALRSSESIKESDLAATISASADVIHEASNSNFVVFTEEYDLNSLFR